MKSRNHATNTILRGISWWWKVEKTFSSLITWKHVAVNEFYGAIDISYQIRGPSFPSSAVWKSRSCYTRELVRQQAHDMWLKNLLSCYSFLIVNCVIMIIKNQIIDLWMLCSVQEPYFLILANLQVLNHRRKKHFVFLIDFSPTCISLNVKFSIHTKNLEYFSYFLPFLINHLE